MAPLPVTIGAPPETTRSSWSLIKIVAGLLPGPLGARARRAGLRGPAGGVGAAGLLRHPPPPARGGVRRPGDAAVHQVKVLRLLEGAALGELTGAVERARELGTAD